MRILSFLPLAALLATVTSTSAQVLQGHLLDSTTGEPIVGANVSLRTEAGDLVRATISGVDGSFHLSAPRAGEYHVHAYRLGYFGYFEGPIPLAAEETVEIRFELLPQAVALDPVSVTAEARMRHLIDAGFYRRKQSGFGHFIERAEIEAKRPYQITDLLRALPGVILVPVRGGGQRVYMRGGLQAGMTGQPCPARIYLDGLPMVMDPDRILQPSELEAVEVYRGPAETPAQYSGASGACGVVLLWSRR